MTLQTRDVRPLRERERSEHSMFVSRKVGIGRGSCRPAELTSAKVLESGHDLTSQADGTLVRSLDLLGLERSRLCDGPPSPHKITLRQKLDPSQS